MHIPSCLIRNVEVIVDLRELTGAEAGVALVGETVDAVEVAVIPRARLVAEGSESESGVGSPRQWPG